MRSLDKILADWKAAKSVMLPGKIRSFPGISWKTRLDDLRSLITTVLQEGYKEEDLRTLSIKNKVIDQCVSKEGMGGKDRRKQIAFVEADWDHALAEMFAQPISEATTVDRTPVEIPKEQPKTEKPFEMNPSDMWIPDRTGMVETQYDIEFMKEMGLIDENGNIKQ